MVRLSAAEGLKRLGVAKAAVYRAALSHDDYGVRHFAVGSLRRVWKAEAIPLLETALKDAAPRVRIAAIRAIGEVGDSRHLPLLKAALRDPDLAARTYAAGNIARILNRAAGKQLRPAAGE